MGGRIRKKKATSTKPASRRRVPSSGARGLVRRVLIDVASLEIARGYDGPLRGLPEPVLVAGLYERRAAPSGEGATVELLERKLIPFEIDGSLPGTFVAKEASLRGRVDSTNAVTLVLFAVEEDDREGIGRLFGLLERPQGLSVWEASRSVPEVTRFASLPPLPRAASKALPSVRILDDASDVAELAEGDDFIGAVVGNWLARTTTRASLRAPFRSADGRNEWCALVNVSIG